MKTKFYLFILLLLPCITYTQTDSTFLNKLEENVNEYYKLDRENIHVQFSKSKYFTNEKIYLSGYVFNQQNQLPSLYTTNVFVEIFNADGVFEARHMLFASDGTFKATIPIKADLESGNYYFRFYTHYMNNFQEDLSSVYPIEIINLFNNEYEITSKNTHADLSINLYPESGVFLIGNSNYINVKVTNYQGKGIANNTGKVYDENNNVVATFFTNDFGYGKFEIKNPKNISYKVEVENNGCTYNQELKNPVMTGASISIDSYNIPNKTSFFIKSNIPNEKELYLVINQNSNILALPISNQSLVLQNEQLFKGINIARIIDKDFNVYAERLFYNHNTYDSEKTTSKNKKNIESTYSYSVFHHNSQVIPEYNIYNSIYINPYTQEASTYNISYFNNPDRIKNFELDLFLMAQKPKEIFQNIATKNYPTEKFNFERGISIEGKVSSDFKPKKGQKIRLIAFPDIMETTQLNSNNEFKFNNLILADSTHLYFALVGNGKNIELGITPKVTGNKRKFLKAFNVPTTIQPVDEISENNISSEEKLPKMSNTILIEDVKIERTSLKRVKQYGMLTGYKAEEHTRYGGMRVIEFLRLHHFIIRRGDPSGSGTSAKAVASSTNESESHYDFASIRIYSTADQSRGFTVPELYIDDIQYFEHSFLENLKMVDVDEIYLNRNIINPGKMNRTMMGGDSRGIIKIYLKPGSVVNTADSKFHLLTGGFTTFSDFQSNLFTENNEVFRKFNTVYWQTLVQANKDNLQFKLPEHKNNTQIFVEGINSDGTIFSKVEEISSN